MSILNEINTQLELDEDAVAVSKDDKGYTITKMTLDHLKVLQELLASMNGKETQEAKELKISIDNILRATRATREV